jgi:uncharacterized protein YndB with AHSA1/START domain
VTTTGKPGAARAIADVGQGVILATVDVGVPPERVFVALSSAAMTKWWSSTEGSGVEGTAFAVESESLEIDPPRKLVQTWKPSWDAGAATTITYWLESIAGGTRLALRHEGFAGREDSCRRHATSWERVLGLLVQDLDPPAPDTRAFFLCRLLPPRASFMQDMTADELAVMQAHVAYWQGLLQAGTAIVFGPVADPKGGWGVSIVRAKDAAAVDALGAADPAISAGRGFRYEVLPMLRAVY